MIVESPKSIRFNKALGGHFGFLTSLNRTSQSLFFESSINADSGVHRFDAQALRTAMDLSKQRMAKSSSLFACDANCTRLYASSGKCGGRLDISKI